MPGGLACSFARQATTGSSSNCRGAKICWVKPDRQVLASGPIISLMDMASGLCVWTRLQEFRAIATMDLRVDYQRPAREHAAIYGRAECYKITRSAAFVRGIAHDGDPADPVANIAGVFMSIAGDTRHVPR